MLSISTIIMYAIFFILGVLFGFTICAVVTCNAIEEMRFNYSKKLKDKENEIFYLTDELSKAQDDYTHIHSILKAYLKATVRDRDYKEVLKELLNGAF